MKNKLMIVAMALVAVSQTMNAENALMTERDAAIQKISMSNGSGRTLAPKFAKGTKIAITSAPTTSPSGLNFKGPVKIENFDIRKMTKSYRDFYYGTRKYYDKAYKAAQGSTNPGVIYVSPVKTFKFAKNPKAFVAGLIGSGVIGSCAYAYNHDDQAPESTTVAPELKITELVQNAVLAEAVKKDEAVTSVKSVTRFEALKNAFNQAGLFAKTQTMNGVTLVKAHPKTSGAVAAATVVAGLGYVAYKKYTTSKAQATVKAAAVTPATPVAVTTPAYAKRAPNKNNRCRVRSYGPRR